MLSGAGQALAEIVKEEIGVKVRSVEVNVLQRCAAHEASKTDLDEAFNSGHKAVELAKAGVTASMVTMTRSTPLIPLNTAMPESQELPMKPSPFLLNGLMNAVMT